MCGNIANIMSELFGMLAQVMVAKLETIDSNVATIVVLTKANAEMTATIKILTATNSTIVAMMAKLGGTAGIPPGFSGTTAPTGHSLNSANIVCSTHKRKPGSPIMVFVTV